MSTVLIYKSSLEGSVNNRFSMHSSTILKRAGSPLLREQETEISINSGEGPSTLYYVLSTNNSKRQKQAQLYETRPRNTLVVPDVTCDRTNQPQLETSHPLSEENLAVKILLPAARENELSHPQATLAPDSQEVGSRHDSEIVSGCEGQIHTHQFKEFVLAYCVRIPPHLAILWKTKLDPEIGNLIFAAIACGSATAQLVLASRNPLARTRLYLLKPTILIICGSTLQKRSIEKAFKGEMWHKLSQDLKQHGIRKLIMVQDTQYCTSCDNDSNHIEDGTLLPLTALHSGGKSIVDGYDDSHLPSVQRLPIDVLIALDYQNCVLQRVIVKNQTRLVHEELDGDQNTLTKNTAVRKSTAIIGGIIQVGNTLYGLSVGHIFQEVSSTMSPLDAKSDAEMGSDDEGPILSDSEWDSLSDMDQDNPYHDISQTYTESPSCTRSKNYYSFLLHGEVPAWRLGNHTSVCMSEGGRIASQRIPSYQKDDDKSPECTDWSLISLSEPVMRSLLNEYRCNTHIQNFKPMNKINVGEVRVVLSREHEELAIIGNTTASVIIDQCQFQAVQLVLNHVLESGTSGAWVLQDDSLVGVIIAANCTLPWAYMLPIETIFEKIQNTLGSTCVKLPAWDFALSTLIPDLENDVHETETLDSGIEDRVSEYAKLIEEELATPLEDKMFYDRRSKLRSPTSPFEFESLESDHEELLLSEAPGSSPKPLVESSTHAISELRGLLANKGSEGLNYQMQSITQWLDKCADDGQILGRPDIPREFLASESRKQRLQISGVPAPTGEDVSTHKRTPAISVLPRIGEDDARNEYDTGKDTDEDNQVELPRRMEMKSYNEFMVDRRNMEDEFYDGHPWCDPVLIRSSKQPSTANLAIFQFEMRSCNIEASSHVADNGSVLAISNNGEEPWHTENLDSPNWTSTPSGVFAFDPLGYYTFPAHNWNFSSEFDMDADAEVRHSNRSVDSAVALSDVTTRQVGSISLSHSPSLKDATSPKRTQNMVQNHPGLDSRGWKSILARLSEKRIEELFENRGVCRVCRLRNLRCDGGRPKCGTCSRSGRDCSYENLERYYVNRYRK